MLSKTIRKSLNYICLHTVQMIYVPYLVQKILQWHCVYHYICVKKFQLFKWHTNWLYEIIDIIIIVNPKCKQISA